MAHTNQNKNWDFATHAIRAGHNPTSEQEHSEAIFPTSSFIFNSAEEASVKFSGDEPGNIYSRLTNPTVRYFQERLAALEGGEACVATSSGMSAILAVMMGLLKQGDHIVCSRSLFGTTLSFLNTYIIKFGIEITYVELSDLEAWEAAITPKTVLCFAETPSNPLTEVVDILYLSEIAHRKNALLVIDNCFCTPALQRPLELGADIVVHSATKYLDGQGRCLGGAVVGDAERVGQDVFGVLRSGGVAMSPFNAWVFLKGLETLNLRMKAHCDNAQHIAEWLQKQDSVDNVFYPGLDSHPQRDLVKQQQNGAGGIVSFVIKGGRAAAWELIDSTQMISITANLGDTKTTITHPATTTHCRVDPEERERSGIVEGLVRLSIGLESVDDIKADLERLSC